MHCDAYHLTEFGGIIFPTSAEELLKSLTPTFNTFTLEEAFAALADFDFMKYPILTATLFSMLGLDFLTLFLLGMWRQHRKKRARQRDDELTEEEEALDRVRALKLEKLEAKAIDSKWSQTKLEIMQKGAPVLVDHLVDNLSRRASATASRLSNVSARSTRRALGAARSMDSSFRQSGISAAFKQISSRQSRLNSGRQGSVGDEGGAVVVFQHKEAVASTDAARQAALERQVAQDEVVTRATRHLVTMHVPVQSSISSPRASYNPTGNQERTIQERMPTRRRKPGPPREHTQQTTTVLPVTRAPNQLENMTATSPNLLMSLMHESAVNPTPRVPAEVSPSRSSALLAARMTIRAHSTRGLNTSISPTSNTIQERIALPGTRRTEGPRSCANLLARSSTSGVSASPPASPPPQAQKQLSCAFASGPRPTLPPSARRAQEKRRNGANLKTKTLSAVSHMQLKCDTVAIIPSSEPKVGGENALYAQPPAPAPTASQPSTSANGVARRPSHTKATSDSFPPPSTGRSIAPRGSNGQLSALAGMGLTSSRILPHSWPPAGSAPAPSEEAKFSEGDGLDALRAQAKADQAMDDKEEDPRESIDADSLEDGESEEDAATGRPSLIRSFTASNLKQRTSELRRSFTAANLKERTSELQNNLKTSVLSIKDWRPPTKKELIGKVKQFRTGIVDGFRSEHTFVSFIAPSEDDEALNDMQVVQLFWFVLIFDLYLNCLQYGGYNPGAPTYSPVDPLNDFINTMIAAVFTVTAVLALRAVFRWGNKRKIREKKGLTKKLWKKAKRTLRRLRNMFGFGSRTPRERTRKMHQSSALTPTPPPSPPTSYPIVPMDNTRVPPEKASSVSLGKARWSDLQGHVRRSIGNNEESRVSTTSGRSSTLVRQSTVSLQLNAIGRRSRASMLTSASILKSMTKTDPEIEARFKEERLRSDRVYYTRQAIAWIINFYLYGHMFFNVVVYAAIFGPEATTDLLTSWLKSLAFAMGVIEPLNIVAVTTIPLLLKEDGCCMKCYSNVFYYWNEVYG